ncbi:MAG: hypothetical protein EB084_17710 [Proteobacteria bacterium]|nr:hypothetical protein [Pseudomonadota bacterium]
MNANRIDSRSTVCSPWLKATTTAHTPLPATMATPDRVSLSSDEPQPADSHVGAAVAVSVAMLALPAFASAHEPGPTSHTSISTPLVPVDRDALSSSASADASTETTAPSTETEAPWYTSLQDKTRGLQETVKGVKGTVASYTDQVNKVLNDTPLAQYRASGTIEDYTWKFDPMVVKADPYLLTRINKFGAGVTVDAAVLKASIEKHDVVGGFDRSQGLRADIHARYQYGLGSRLDPVGAVGDPNIAGFAGPRVEAFQRWQSREGDWKQTYEFNLGASHDLPSSTSMAYVRTVQRFENGEITKSLLGSGSRLNIELEEGLQRNWGAGSTNVYYRAFAGATKPVSFKAFGHDVKVDVEAGLQAQGNLGGGRDVKPVVRAHTHW